MKYRITALKDVTVRAFVHTQKIEEISGHMVAHPSSEEKWICLRKGEVQEGLGLVIGVHPRWCPDKKPLNIEGVSMVIAESWSNDDLPKEFFGLYRLEVQTEELSHS